MALWSRTKTELQRLIENKARRLSGTVILTADDRFAIFSAINASLIDISIERGFDILKVITSDTTVSTVAGQNYVDLSAAIVNVIDGSLRIIAEDQILSPMSLSAFYAIDPGEDVSHLPSFYAIDTNGSGGYRLLLRDTPDAVYTIDLKVESIPDEDSVSTLPGWMHGLLWSLSASVALEALGFDGGQDWGRYQERLKNVREKQRGRSGPSYLPSSKAQARSYDPERRRPDR